MVKLCNKTRVTFQGLERLESPDYPEEAIREALLNAIVHRDYSFSGSIIININDKEMEFISLGGLLPGLSPDDIRSGISQPRNKNLAEIFHRMHLIESYGTGILEFIEKNGFITELEIGELLQVKRTRAYTLAKQMADDGLLIYRGRGKEKKYFINK